MREVLISIQPKWCELIASGKKTLELRKTKPKIDTPFKCYIYCTKSKDMLWVLNKNNRAFTDKFAATINAKDVGGATKANGKVIGEFVCDDIEHYTSNCTVFESVLLPTPSELEEMCLTLDEFNGYGTRYKLLYGWRISDLLIYDKPKELREFCRYDNTYDNAFGYAFEDRSKYVPIKRPPQSWCYVEKGGGE